MTAAIGQERSTGPVATVAARAGLAALLAVVTTFWPQPDRTAAFGLAVLGAFLLAQGAVLGAGARWVASGRRGRRLVVARAAVSLVAGVLALVVLSRGEIALAVIEAVAFLVIGVLEVVAGLLAPGPAGHTGDAVVVGGLQVVVGLILIIVGGDLLLTIGLLGAWGAVVAVYLGIGAVHLARGGVRA